MKRLRLLLIVVVLGSLVLALVPTASAQAFRPLQSEGSLELVFPEPPDVPHWAVTLTGDLSGVARVDVLWTEIQGAIEHWSEVMAIQTDDGATIVVESRGVWNLETYNFETRGTVTSAEGADGAYDHVVGLKAHARGSTSGVVPPLTGEMTLRIK